MIDGKLRQPNYILRYISREANFFSSCHLPTSLQLHTSMHYKSYLSWVIHIVWVKILGKMLLQILGYHFVVVDLFCGGLEHIIKRWRFESSRSIWLTISFLFGEETKIRSAWTVCFGWGCLWESTRISGSKSEVQRFYHTCLSV